jgi:hypothetical protein
MSAMSASPDDQRRRRTFARIVASVLTAFAIAFLVGAVQVGRALWSGRPWMNFRGEPISAAELRHELIFLAALAVVCSLLSWYWHRVWRRMPPPAD